MAKEESSRYQLEWNLQGFDKNNNKCTDFYLVSIQEYYQDNHKTIKL